MRGFATLSYIVKLLGELQESGFLSYCLEIKFPSKESFCFYLQESYLGAGGSKKKLGFLYQVFIWDLIIFRCDHCGMHLLLEMLAFSSSEHISRLVVRKGRTAKRRGYQSLMVAKQLLYPLEVEDAFCDSGSVTWVSHSFSICHLFLTFTIVSPLPPISLSLLVIVFGFYPFTSNY